MYLEDIGIELNNTYKINSIDQYGFTDWTLESNIQISKEDKNRILKELKRKIKFVRSESRKKYFEKFNNNKDSVFGFIVDSKYNYEIEIGRYEKIKDKKEKIGYKRYLVKIDTLNNNFYFQYEYE